MRTLTGVALACLLGGGVAACVSETDDGGYYGGGGDTFTGGGVDGGEDSGSFGDGAPSGTPMLAKVDPNASMMQSPGQGVGVFTQYDSGGHWYVWWTCDTSISNESCAFAIKVSVAQGAITDAMSQGFSGADSLAGGAGLDGVDGGAGSTNSNETSVAGSSTSGTGGSSGSGTGESSGSGTGGSSGSGSGSSASATGTVSGSSGSNSSVLRQPGNTPSPEGAASFVATTTTTTTVQGVHFNTAPGAIITLSATLGGEYSGRFLFFVQDDKVNGAYTGMLTDPLELEPTSP